MCARTNVIDSPLPELRHAHDPLDRMLRPTQCIADWVIVALEEFGHLAVKAMTAVRRWQACT